MSFLTMKYNLKISNEERYLLRFLCHISKNIYNSALYELRQNFFTNKEHLISYFELNSIMKNNENYNILNTYMTLCTNRNAFSNMQKFINHKNKSYAKLPDYLPNKGYYPLITDQVRILTRDSKKYFKLPLSNIVRTSKIFNNEFKDTTIKDYLTIKQIKNINIPIPKELYDKEIKQIRIVPEYNSNYFSVQLTYIDNQVSNYHGNKTMSIDLGINNLASIVTSDNESFIIDGRKAKSINQLYNKQTGILNSKKQPKTPLTKRQLLTLRKRNLRIEDYYNKATRQIINLAMQKQIGEIVIGYNKGMKSKGIKNDTLTNKQKAVINQSYVGLPLFKFKTKLAQLAKRFNIKVILQEESYTSKCSFYDDEEIASHIEYNGKRINRLFKTKDGHIINADINGALNILKKYKTESDELIHHLRNSGLTTPIRLQVSL